MICSHRNVKFIKSEFNSFQILFILHSIYEITTNDIGLIGKWIIGTEYCAFAFLGAKNFLITLSTTDMLCIWLNKICKKKFKWNLNCDWVIHSNLDIANPFCSLYRIIHYIKCYMIFKYSKWELSLVHYIAKFAILRFVISRFEYI